jgi:autotransporter-associated beta strand protein
MKRKPSVQMITKAVVLASALMFGNTVSAADYYWDNNDTTNGFGTAGGTWADPTVNLWSLDPTGVAAREASVTTGTSDALHFGTAAVGLAAGTITVSGTVSANSLTFGSASGHVTLSGGTSLTLGGTTTAITVNTVNGTITFPIAGTGGLTKDGAGQLRLSGANTYSGATTISAGTLTLFGGGRLDSGSYSGAIINNGNFQHYGTSGQTLSGNISGSGAINKVSQTSDLTLSGTNTYSGATSISAGRVAINNAGALSPNTSVTVSGTGQLFFQSSTAGGTYNNAMTLSGLGHVEGDNTQIGAIRLENNMTLGGTLTLPADARVGIIGARSATLSGQVTGSGGLEFHGVKNGNNTHHCTLTLSNTGNDYAGTTTISSKDYTTTARTGNTTTLKLGAAGVIPDGAGKGIVALSGTNADHLTILDLKQPRPSGGWPSRASRANRRPFREG